MKLTPPVRDVHSTAIIHPSIEGSHKVSNKAPNKETTKDPTNGNRSAHGRHRAIEPPYRPPIETPYSNSLSQGVGDDPSRKRGDARPYAGGFPRDPAYERRIRALISGPVPTLIYRLITRGHTLEQAIPKQWAYAQGSSVGIQALSCDGVSLSDPWDHPLERGTETRNSSGADPVYIPFRDPELRAGVNGGPANPPHIFAGSEGGVVV